MKKWLKISLIVFVLFILLTISGISIFIANILHDNQINLDISKLDNLSKQVALYDANNRLISNNNINGVPTINIDELNDYTKNAFIAIEDKDFYKHHGLNYKRIVKAFFNNLSHGYVKEGASTITQQLIKNSHLSNEKTLNRKIKEAVLALDLEKKYTKEQILGAYLNIIYFGNNAYGIQQASKYYFGHDATSLTLSESATLAGIIKSPLLYSPTNSKENCKKRRNLVLAQMLAQDFITKEQYNKAINEEIILTTQKDNNNIFDYFVTKEAMKVLHMDEPTLYNSNLKIYTTQDAKLQQYMGLCMQPTDKQNQYSSGMAIDSQTGAVLACTSTLSSVNADIARSPASLIKPILCYASAFEHNILSPSSPLLDEPLTYDDYAPHNVGDKYCGWTDVRYSLAHSLNIPAIKILEYVGIKQAKSFATRFGLSFSKNDNHLALALGSMQNGVTLTQIVSAYSVFANQGKQTKLHFISKIINQDGQILYQYYPKTQQVCKKSTAFMINDILKDSAKYGTAKKLANLNLPLASKTGTNGASDGTNTDAWNITYNNKFCTGFWYGNISGDDQYNLTKEQNGGTIATNSAYKFWSKLKTKYNFEDFTVPDSVEKINIDTRSLKSAHTIELAAQGTPDRYIKIDYYPKEALDKLKISKQPKTNQTTFTIASQKTDDYSLNITWQSKLNKNYLVYLSKDNKPSLLANLIGDGQTMIYLIQNPPQNVNFEIFVLEKDYKSTLYSNKLKIFISKEAVNNKMTKQMSKIWLNKKNVLKHTFFN
ncbi:MAG: transglycosylase domain-containing protein [Clostridia bacterium]|nr:transglycosylase domain-containing protein [Clostridia bacterium]